MDPHELCKKDPFLQFCGDLYRAESTDRLTDVILYVGLGIIIVLILILVAVVTRAYKIKN
jgi:hypothetical protein